MDSSTIPLIIILLCLCMSAYFSATETAFSSLNRLRVKNMAEKGNRKAMLVMRLSENYDSLLSTILIGNNIVNILGTSLTTALFIKLINAETGPTVATVVATVVVLIFGEVSPKSIAKESPEKFAMLSAPLLKFFVILLTPFNWLFKMWKKLISLVFKSEGEAGITEEELMTMIDEAEKDGGIDEEERTLLRSTIEFGEQEAIDILTPRIDITAIPSDATKEEIAKIFAETAYSRLPVYEDTIDHIIGVLNQKDFHNYVCHTKKEISDVIRPVLFIPKNKKIGALLKELQRNKQHIAVVLDEFGGTVGMVTLEDILEELVGEIWDEHDEVTRDIIKKSENEYIALGSADIDEIFQEFQLPMSEEQSDTLVMNGWVMSQLGRVPEKGDSFEYAGVRVTVLEMDDNRVGKVSITVLPDFRAEE